jgi:hypothetical protein
MFGTVPMVLFASDLAAVWVLEGRLPIVLKSAQKKAFKKSLAKDFYE